MRVIIAGLLVIFSFAGLWAAESVEIQNKRVGLFYDEQFLWQNYGTLKYNNRAVKKELPAGEIEENATTGAGSRHMFVGKYGDGNDCLFKGMIGFVAVYSNACWKNEDVMRRYQEAAGTYK